MYYISTHNEYRNTYIEVQRPHSGLVTWGLRRISSAGLKLSITSNSFGMLG